jgi:hypothetical protein
MKHILTSIAAATALSVSALGSAAPADDAQAIRPFQVHVPNADLVDLRKRLAATRWPDKETVQDTSQGVQLATMSTSNLKWQLLTKRRTSSTQGIPAGKEHLAWVTNTATLIHGERDAVLRSAADGNFNTLPGRATRIKFLLIKLAFWLPASVLDDTNNVAGALTVRVRNNRQYHSCDSVRGTVFKHGVGYEKYRRTVPMLVPGRIARTESARDNASTRRLFVT